MDFKQLHKMMDEHQKLVALELELNNANNSNLKDAFDGISLRFGNGEDYIHIPKNVVFATKSNMIEQYHNLVRYYRMSLEQEIKTMCESGDIEVISSK